MVVELDHIAWGGEHDPGARGMVSSSVYMVTHPRRIYIVCPLLVSGSDHTRSK